MPTNRYSFLLLIFFCAGLAFYFFASKNLVPVNGLCGTADSKNYTYDVIGYGSDTQCSAGVSSNTAFPNQGTTIFWVCAGANGGSSSGCDATRNLPSIDGVCGTANGKTYSYEITTYGSDTQCSSGALSTDALTQSAFPGQGSTIYWTCSGQNGGSPSSCSAKRNLPPTNGVCGTANGKTYAYNAISYGSDTHCGAGLPSETTFPEQGATVPWTCKGSNGGTDSMCSASKNLPPTKGACGTANKKTYAHNVIAYNPDTQCSVGTSSNINFPALGLTVFWVCSGTNGGDSSSKCSASRVTPVNGQCGTANGKIYTYNINSYGSDTQCSSGKSSNVAFPEQGGTATWTCNGANGGSDFICAVSRNSAPINGQGGTANGKIYAYDAAGYGSDTQCSVGTSTNTAFPEQGATVSWTCSGVNGGSDFICVASRSLAPVNGVCGTANGVEILAAPTGSALCSKGVPSKDPASVGGIGYEWTCVGQNGGINSSCSAPRGTPVWGEE